jgi:4-amino-4-deoxy-L-arabinose transferase-like glycosyltransferase
MAASAGKYPELDRLASWIAAAVLLVAALFKLGLLGQNVFPFNADEAIVALMARHTLQGEWPIFFYGQAYMGSLDATLVAIGFRLLGERVIVIRLVQTLLYGGIILSTILLAWRITRNKIAGLAAGLVLAIPTTNLTLYSTASLGGYGEALLLGNLICLTGLRVIRAQTPLRTYLLLGFLIGLGFWAFGLTLVYSLPVLFLIWRTRRTSESTVRPKLFLAFCVGALVGLSPVIFWASSHGVRALLSELSGSAIAGVAGGNYPSQVLLSIRNLILFGISVIFGFRPPWDVAPLFVPGLLVAAAFWLSVGVDWIRRRGFDGSSREGLTLLRDLAIMTLLGYILTPFGVDPSGRYFLPLSIVLAILAGNFLVRKTGSTSMYLRWLLFSGLILFNFVSNVQVAAGGAPGFTTQFDASTRIDHSYDQKLIDFLSLKDAKRGYTNYWVSYPLAFESEEDLIFVPALPYHADLRFTERDNRYAPYDVEVALSRRIALVTTMQEELDRVISEFLSAAGIHWDEASIGPYHVFYDLSEPISIDQLKQKWRE